jgi:hypothetical protein
LAEATCRDIEEGASDLRNLNNLVIARQQRIADARDKKARIIAYKTLNPASTVRQASEALGIPPSTILSRTVGIWGTQKDRDRMDRMRKI